MFVFFKQGYSHIALWVVGGYDAGCGDVMLPLVEWVQVVVRVLGHVAPQRVGPLT